MWDTEKNNLNYLSHSVFLPRNCSYSINGKNVDTLFYTPKLKFKKKYSISMEDLVITNHEIELFKNGGQRTQNSRQITEKTTRIQSPERVLNQIFLFEHFKEMLDESKSSALAEHLNALAGRHGFKEDVFKKQIMTGWIQRCKEIKKQNSPNKT